MIQMATQWFYARDTTQHGPVDEAFLFQLAERGELGPSDLLWRPGLDSWIRADILPGLFAPPPLPSVVGVQRAVSAPILTDQQLRRVGESSARKATLGGDKRLRARDVFAVVVVVMFLIVMLVAFIEALSAL